MSSFQRLVITDREGKSTVVGSSLLDYVVGSFGATEDDVHAQMRNLVKFEPPSETFCLTRSTITDDLYLVVRCDFPDGDSVRFVVGSRPLPSLSEQSEILKKYKNALKDAR